MISIEFCPANPKLRRMGGDTGYLLDSVNPVAYDEAVSLCGSNGAGLVSIQTIQDSIDFTILMREKNLPAGSSIWTGLMSPFASGNISCTNGACDSQPLKWSDGSRFTFDGTVIDSLTWSGTVQHACSVVNVDYGDFKGPVVSADCFATKHIALCQGSCLLDEFICPETHPYAIANGLSCCRSFQRSDECSSDGFLEYADEAGCCLDGAFIPCASGSCQSNSIATSKYSLYIQRVNEILGFLRPLFVSPIEN